MLLALMLLSLFFTMLLFPETVFQGACDGLLLWYQILIPTLFPYLIVTGLLLKTDGAAVVPRLLFRPFHLLFGTSFYGSFAVLSGFLCGYPMGAKIIADLLLQGKISLEEASYLLSFCNNASPSFIITFLVLNTIHFPGNIRTGNVRSFRTGESHFPKTSDAQNEFFCVRVLYPEQFRNACKSRRLPDNLFCTSCIIGASANSFTWFSSPEILS